MVTRTHIHEETMPAGPEQVFSLLHTPSAIRQWWSASRAIVLPQTNGIWAAVWGSHEDAPDYVTAAVIKVFEPPRRMLLTDYRYFAKNGPLPFAAEFVTEFLVLPHSDGAILRVTQDGFPSGPEADDFYAGCQMGWCNTFAGIREFLTCSQT